MRDLFERRFITLPWRALVIVAALLMVLTFIGDAWFLTVEPDEAWNLMSVANAMPFDIRHFPAISQPVISSGGLYALIQGAGAAERVGHARPPLDVIDFYDRHCGRPLRICAPPLRFDNTGMDRCGPVFLHSGAVSSGRTSDRRDNGDGIAAVHNSAMARTRAASFAAGCVVRDAARCRGGDAIDGGTDGASIPALDVAHGADLGRGLVTAAVAATGMLITAILLIGGYIFAFGGAVDGHFLDYVRGATGAGQFHHAFDILSFMQVSEPFLPTVGIAVLIAALVVATRTAGNGPLLRVIALLIFASVAGWVAWVLKAPIAHVRYLWPQVPMIWTAAILLVLDAVHRDGSRRAVAALCAGTIVLCGVQGLVAIRAMVAGDTLNLLYAATRQSPAETPRWPLAASADQRVIAGADRFVAGFGSGLHDDHRGGVSHYLPDGTDIRSGR